MGKTRVSIVGAAGYSGEELIRLLLRHPEVELVRITSRKNDGQPISSVFPRFAESGLNFSYPDVDDLAAVSDVVFLALPHGLAAEYAQPLVEKGVRIFDLSADFRLNSLEKYEAYYGEHPAPELLKAAVYGSPERRAEKLKDAPLVACPGCYPTSITLALCPVLKAGLVHTDGIVVSSMSGVSGAGRKVDLPFIFPECNESVRPYGVTGHRHLPEIEQELAEAAGLSDMAINFIPHLVPVTRGIHSTIVARLKDTNTTAQQVWEVLSAAYADKPFVRVLPLGKLADTKHITLTNVCEIGLAVDPHTGNLILSSAIDNLTKGAAGQAVQAMNLVLGFEETTGLL